MDFKMAVINEDFDASMEYLCQYNIELERYLAESVCVQCMILRDWMAIILKALNSLD